MHHQYKVDLGLIYLNIMIMLHASNILTLKPSDPLKLLDMLRIRAKLLIYSSLSSANIAA